MVPEETPPGPRRNRHEPYGQDPVGSPARRRDARRSDDPAWAPGPGEETSFLFRLTLAGGLTSFGHAFELGTDERGEHTLSMTMGISTSSGELMSLKVGQPFDNAVLQIFDQTLTPLGTIRLTSARVAAVRSKGERTIMVLTLTLAGKSVAVTFP